jgi:iron-sulfur cluster assembly protein
MALIELSAAARDHLSAMCEITGAATILLAVTSKGCGGHGYSLRFVDDDFGGEALDLGAGRRLVIDQRSLLWLAGVRIDYHDNGIDSTMLFDNPHETGRCGCGQSFTCR